MSNKKYEETPVILFETELKNGHGQPFIRVLEATTPNGGKYVYSQRAGVDSVKFILVDNNSRNYALVQEIKPPLLGEENAGKYNLSAFGGSLPIEVKRGEQGLKKTWYLKQRMIMTVIQEVKQETGYLVSAERVEHYFTRLLGSQSDELVHCYIVDVTNLKPMERELESGEESSSVNWMNAIDVMGNGCLAAMALVSMHQIGLGRKS